MDFFAGCVGGGAGVIVGHPLDTVKVRLQTQSLENAKYRGTFHALYTIVKQESVSGLYKGISSPLYGVSLVNALVFGVYGCLQPYVTGAPGNNSLWAHAAAGGFAGAAQSIVCSPMELVKIRMQLDESVSHKPSSFQVLKNIFKNEGGLRRGVFKGWLVTVSREIPGFASYFCTYEFLVQELERRNLMLTNLGQISTVGMMLSGGTAGVVSWLACFPQDVIKTRLQSDVTNKYNGVLDCATKTYQSEGTRVFTRTLPSLLIRAFPMNAVTFPVVTWIIRHANSKEDSLETRRDEIEHLLKDLQPNFTISPTNNNTRTISKEFNYFNQFGIIPYRFLTFSSTHSLNLTSSKAPTHNFDINLSMLNKMTRGSHPLSTNREHLDEINNKLLELSSLEPSKIDKNLNNIVSKSENIIANDKNNETESQRDILLKKEIVNDEIEEDIVNLDIKK